MYLKSKKYGIGNSYIKVLIIKSANYLAISSSSRIKVSLLSSQKIIYNNSGKKLKFYPEKIRKPILVESWGSVLKVNGIPYRGMIEIHNIMGKLSIVNVVKLDEYLFGVVPSEMSAGWHLEAIKAQAVAARSYAFYHILLKKNGFYDLDSTVNFQMYKGYSVESEKSNRAVKETKGEIMIYANKPILAFFHSTCGGWTSNNEQVWSGEKIPYLRGRSCNFCQNSKYYSWKEKLSLYSIKIHLRKLYRNVGAIKQITFKSHKNRVVSVLIRHSGGLINMPGNKFRLLFSAKKIKSLFFRAQKIKNGLLLSGKGWGHGVGMCQYGALGMAQKNYSYRKILKFYYQDVKIIKIKR
jgi:stage II sporulation protein D